MAEAKPEQEPSMEEILASIRRIISEDGTPEDEGANGDGDNTTEVQDVYELTEVVDEPEAVAEEPAAEEAEAEPEAEAGA